MPDLHAAPRPAHPPLKIASVYPRLRCLLVEDAQAMLLSLRATLAGLGVEKIDVAGTVNEVLFKIERQKREYDLIVCDHDLHDQRNGQQLLEELRYRKLIPYRSVFIMISGQRSYQSVVHVAEWAPDAYLIKPFASDTLIRRIEQALKKRLFLGAIHEAMEAHDLPRATALIDTRLGSPGPFATELMRQKAEVLVEDHRYDEARQLLESIVARHRLPWAHLGLARLAHLTRKLDEAVNILVSIVAMAPNYLTAWDLLANVHLEKDDPPMALATLESALRYASRNIARHRQIGQVALLNRNLLRADVAYQAILAHGSGSSLVSANDYAASIALAAVNGRLEETRKILREAERLFPGSDVLEAGARLAEGEAAALAGDSATACDRLSGLIGLIDKLGTDAVSVPIHTAIRCAASLGETELAEELASAAIGRSYGAPQAIRLASSMMADGGIDDGPARIEAIARREIAAINNRAVELAKAGRLFEAIELLLHIAHQESTTIIAQLNACQAILMYLEEKGWNEEMAREGRRLLERALMRDPEHPRAKSLRKMMQAQIARHAPGPTTPG